MADLVSAQPNLSRDDLIRIGGKSKDVRLQRFSERSAYQSDFEVNACRSRVDALIRLRESIKFCLESHVPSFLSHYQRIFFGDDEGDRRKAATMATLTLMESIIRLEKLRSLNKIHGEQKSKQSPAEVVVIYAFIPVDGEGKASAPIQKTIQSKQGVSYIPTLVAESTSNKDEHWGDLLEKWLLGKSFVEI